MTTSNQGSGFVPEAMSLVDTLVASVNEAHHSKDDGWRDACFQAADRTYENIRAHLTAHASAAEGLREALQWTLRELEMNTCHHQETYRGGAIWTICRDCGKQWADDRGGFKPYLEPAQIENARTALAAYQQLTKG